MNDAVARPTPDSPDEATPIPATIDVPDESLPHGLSAAAAAWPDRVAVDFLRSTLTYAELDAAVARAAQALLDLGVEPGDRVAIALPNCTTHVVAFSAVLRIGGVVVEHNPTYTAPQLRHQLADSGARVAIVWEKAARAALGAREGTALETVVAVDVSRDLPTTSRLALRLPVRAARATRAALRDAVPDGALRWERLVRRRGPQLPASHPYPASDAVALLQYTGGTTGTPKGAVLTHRNLVANAVQCEVWTRTVRASETLYGALPFFHAFGLTLCLGYGLRTGATLVVFPRFDPAAMVAAQRRRPGTFLPAVPPMIERFTTAAREAGVDLTSFRFAFSGAMALPASTARAWEEATGGYAIEGYGMTETSPVALGNPVSPERRPGALGLAFPSTQVRVVDAETLQDVPDGARGELLLRGPQVFSGYWNRPEESAEQLLPDGWLRTGDVVVRDEDGFVTLVDRIKEMIVTGGFKVYPSQVEDLLREMPGVADVAVVGTPGGDLGEKVVAAIVLDGSVPTISLAELRAWASERVASYAVPRELVVVTELPRSIIGKVLRRVVRDDLVGRRPE
ncbi:AMP-binding protein [Litorihabitans aurantiacus]|uniref:Long-chain-fatty-acid--CoA ligase n=1 Tax=Litorihabitans aurantiacus TaxID=1930061 RepID=A0AA37UU32_9MICO|nr:AMP-binding protein [Litorihabitans aurantiacus]GMA30171.1 long-chain-fatty-acid--CoA ligase [Litorihabitans aurantiacus]